MTRIRFPRMWESRWRAPSQHGMARLETWMIAFWAGRKDDDWACRPRSPTFPGWPTVWFSVKRS